MKQIFVRYRKIHTTNEYQEYLHKYQEHLHEYQEYLREYQDYLGHAVAQLVEALRYKLEGRGFDSRCSHWNFSVT
jgi:hypothetical protein